MIFQAHRAEKYPVQTCGKCWCEYDARHTNICPFCSGEPVQQDMHVSPHGTVWVEEEKEA